MIKITFNVVDDKIAVSCECSGDDTNLAYETSALITERNIILLRILEERPALSPYIQKVLEKRMEELEKLKEDLENEDN